MIAYEDFYPEPFTEREQQKFNEDKIDINTARRILISAKKEDVDIELFVKFKEEYIEDASKLVFGNNKIILDMEDDLSVHFYGAVISNVTTISDPIELLNSLERYIEGIAI